MPSNHVNRQSQVRDKVTINYSNLQEHRPITNKT